MFTAYRVTPTDSVFEAMKARTKAAPNLILRRQREQRHWTQTELARMLGTTYLTVGRWESGATSPSLYYRKQLCELFGLPPEELGLATPATQEAPVEDIQVPITSQPVWYVPYRRNPFFTGREPVLARLEALLGSGRAAALTQAHALSGLGGIGKTQTAVEYAYRHRRNYQAVLWARAETREALHADLVTIAQALDVAEQQEQERIIAAVKRWLATHHNWLLILDNVEDITLLEDIMPDDSTGHILLTMRAQSSGGIAQRLDLEKMQQEEGALFLLRRARLIPPDAPLEAVPAMQHARDIAQLLDGLPLALDQAGAYIEETGCSLLDYLQRFQERRANLLGRRGGQATEHQDSVSATLALAFDRVARSNPASAELLRLCAFLDPDAIPEEMITIGAPELGPLLQPVATDPFALDEAFAVLRKYSLLRRHPDNKTLTIHRLVQAVLKDQMDEQAQRQWAERCVRAINRAFPAIKLETWPDCQRLLPQVQTCQQLIKQWDIACIEAARLFQRAGDYLKERSVYQEAEPLLKQSLVLYERLLGPDHPDMANCLDTLASIYWYQNNYEQSVLLNRRVLAMREKALGPDHPDVANSLNNLALVHQEQGQYALAESLTLRSAAIWEQLSSAGSMSGVDLPDWANCLNNLGLLYMAQGNYAQAEAPLKQAITLWDQIQGPVHPGSAVTIHNLAYLYYLQAHYMLAEPLFQRALSIHEEALGAEHFWTAFDINDLATLYRDQGEFEKAGPLLRQALHIYENTLGSQHPHIAQNLNQQALLYHAQGDDAQAEQLLKRSLLIREQALGPEHPDVAYSLDALAEIYSAQQRYAEAEALAQRALTIRERKSGAQHPDTARCLNTLGLLYVKQQQHAKAAPLLQRALTIREQRLGTDHPDTLSIRKHLTGEL